MTGEEFEDAKQLWQFAYARLWFVRARQAAEHVIETQMDAGSPLYFTLITGIHVLYGKAFTRCHGVGKLDEKIIPATHKDSHQSLMTLRHKMYAHLDAAIDPGASGGDLAHPIYLLRIGRKICPVQKIVLSELGLIRDIISLCTELEAKCTYQVQKLMRRHHKKLPPKDGYYLINIMDPSGPMLRYEPTLDQEPTPVE